MRATIADRIHEVKGLHSRGSEVTFTVEGITHTAFSTHNAATHFVAIDGDVFELKQPNPRRARRRPHHGENSLSASMPGQTTKVLIAEVDSVQHGQPLIVLEAMKMEIKIAAPHDGHVA